MPAASGVGAYWLALREPADAVSRAPDLVDLLLAYRGGPRLREAGVPDAVLPDAVPPGVGVTYDLGSGTGSMTRWLAPRTAGPQRWVLYDRDTDLVAQSAAYGALRSADGSSVRVEARRRDITALEPGDLDGASLITASALLDLLTADEVGRIVASAAAAGCPVLFTLTVLGLVELSPPDRLDAAVAAAFDAHQRRTVDGRRLLGPDAAAVTAQAMARAGMAVSQRPSPWRLDTSTRDLALTVEWLRGWVAAAFEQEPALAAATPDYLRARLEQAARGGLRVTVHHVDLLGLPR